MPTISDARTYADTAIEQGLALLSSVQDRIAALSTDARDRASLSTEDGKGIADDIAALTRKQVLINIGIGDAVVASLAKRGAELPADAKQTATKLLEAARQAASDAADRAAKAQDKITATGTGLKDRGESVADAARDFSFSETVSSVRGDVQALVSQLQDGLDKLALRGEQVASDLRHDPVVARVISQADKNVERAANEVTAVAQKIRTRAATQAERETGATTSTPVRPVRASAIPSHKSTVRKTPAGEAPISTTPAYKAVAEETAVRQAAAKKAARTRKANDEEAAAKREATNAKAAATRKRNAAAKKATATKTIATKTIATKTTATKTTAAKPAATKATAANTTPRKTTGAKATASKATAAKSTAPEETVTNNTTADATAS